MNKRSAFKIFVVALYVSMIILFFKFAESKNREKFDTADTTGCNEESPCVRICTENRNEVVVNETSINFELTNPLTNITSLFSVLNGRPCEKMKILEAQWKFSSSGSISVNESSFSVSEYCLEISEGSVNDSEHQWNVMVCDESEAKVYVKIHLIILSSTVGILLLALFLFVFINELRNNVHGKCVIGFLLSLMIADTFSRISLVYPYLFAFSSIGLISTFLWLNVMIFDVYWTLHNFESTSGGRFKHYGYAVVGILSFIFLMMICFTSILVVSYIFLGLIIFKNISCFVLTTMKIYEMSAVRIDFGNKRFHHEQIRFLTYLTLFTVTLLTWSIEICTWDLVASYKSYVAADALKCLHAVTIFSIVVLKRNVREIVIRNVCCC